MAKRFHWGLNNRHHKKCFLKWNKIRRTFQTKIFQKQFYKPLRKLISQKALNRVKWVNLGHKTQGGPQLFVSQNSSPPLPFVLSERNITQKHFSIQLFNRTYCLKKKSEPTDKYFENIPSLRQETCSNPACSCMKF